MELKKIAIQKQTHLGR